MAILAKKTIFQRSTTFFAHFAIFIFLISFFFFSLFTTACVTRCCVAQKSTFGDILRENSDAVPHNSSKLHILLFCSLGLRRFTLNKNIKNGLASKNQLPTFENKQLNKNTI